MRRHVSITEKDLAVRQPGACDGFARARGFVRRTALAVLCLCFAGCTGTPQQHLVGRWYNDEVSVRFRPDGTLVYNSVSTGLVTGRYYFDGEVRDLSAGTAVPNLTLDLVVEGRISRRQHELQFLGDERMRLQPANEIARGLPSDGIPNVIVLRKAAADDTALAGAR